ACAALSFLIFSSVHRGAGWSPSGVPGALPLLAADCRPRASPMRRKTDSPGRSKRQVSGRSAPLSPPQRRLPLLAEVAEQALRRLEQPVELLLLVAVAPPAGLLLPAPVTGREPDQGVLEVRGLCPAAAGPVPAQAGHACRSRRSARPGHCSASRFKARSMPLSRYRSCASRRASTNAGSLAQRYTVATLMPAACAASRTVADSSNARISFGCSRCLLPCPTPAMLLPPSSTLDLLPTAPPNAVVRLRRLERGCFRCQTTRLTCSQL